MLMCTSSVLYMFQFSVSYNIYLITLSVIGSIRSCAIPVLTILPGYPQAFAHRKVPAPGHLIVNVPQPLGHLSILGAFPYKVTGNMDLLSAHPLGHSPKYLPGPQASCGGWSG